MYKHAVSMRCDREEIIEVHDDYVVIREHLVPDPNGPFWVMSDYEAPAWATRTTQRPAPSKDSGKEE